MMTVTWYFRRFEVRGNLKYSTSLEIKRISRVVYFLIRESHGIPSPNSL